MAICIDSADGSCQNLTVATQRQLFFAHKIYQMDYSRITKEFRMLDQFLPQETQDRGAANDLKNFKFNLKNTAIDERGTGVWPREVVVWNRSGLVGVGMLASVWVDVLSGRFTKEKTVKIAYRSVENMWLEGGNGDDMDVDSGEESD